MYISIHIYIYKRLETGIRLGAVLYPGITCPVLRRVLSFPRLFI